MKMRNILKRSTLFGLITFLVLATACSTKNKTIHVFAPDVPQIQFAVNELATALKNEGYSFNLSDSLTADIVISVSPQADGLKSEGFQLTVKNGKVHVIGLDPAGAMYGGLELAEQIGINGFDGVKTTTQNPYMARRGTKFNIPLDMRSPSYTDPCDAAQKNIPEMWSFDFWKEYIDDLARYHYNYISLWSLHPFPSMVKVPGYEDVALDDVQRSTVEWKEFYSGNGVGFTAPEIVANPEIVKKITMDEKIAFWQKVMKYAKDRNVDFYVVTWNIFVDGTDGKYGITDDIKNPVTIDYFRKSVKQMFVTYPDLAGIGLTTGENMPKSSAAEKEDWAFETYAQGMLDAAAEMPDRKFTFIHRQHQTAAKAISDKFKPLLAKKNIEFLFSFKYAQAHVYSATEQNFHLNFVKDIEAEGMKTIWTLRNDDIYQFRWGAPDFVREFIKNIPYDVSRGYYYGSDQWVWGREFLMKDTETPRQLEVEKHWYQFMLWGRLGYNPEMSDDRFTQIIQVRFPEVNAEKLFAAWQNASMIYPTTTGFHWGSLDFQWYIEGCKSRPGPAGNETGFHDVNRFISLPPHPMSGFQSIPDFVKMMIEGGTSELKSPFAVAQMLHDYSDKAMKGLEGLKAGNDRELKFTLHDIKTIALLGKYYALKIEGSTNLALFRETKDSKYQEIALEKITESVATWKKYTDSASEQSINPLWTNRVGYVDWSMLNQWAEDDIKIVEKGL